MEKLKNDLIELIEVGYDYEAKMNVGNGWEPYEGCRQNLVMILEDPDTRVHIVTDEEDDIFEIGIRTYRVTLPKWWRVGSIAVLFAGHCSIN